MCACRQEPAAGRGRAGLPGHPAAAGAARGRRLARGAGARAGRLPAGGKFTFSALQASPSKQERELDAYQQVGAPTVCLFSRYL